MWWQIAVAYGASVTVSPGDDVGALTSSLQAGDVVTFTAGTFEVDDQILWTGEGEQGNEILITGDPKGGTVLRSSTNNWIANIDEASHVVVEYITFEGTDPETIDTDGLRIDDSSFITVRDCVVRNVDGTGLRIEGDSNNLVIERNEIGPVLGASGVVVGCNDGGCWLQDSVIQNNQVHDVNGTAFLFFPGTQNVQILDNVAYRAENDGMVLPDTQFGDQNIVTGNALWQIEDDGLDITGPALVQNNVIFEIGDEGIWVHDEGNLTDVQVSHNTVVRTNGWGALLQGWYEIDDLVFANNVIANATGRSLSYDDPRSDPDFYANYGKDEPDTTNFIANNVVTGLIGGFDPLVRPTWSIEGGGVADFRDIDNFDFYPSASARSRDAGSPLGEAFIPVVDFNRIDRDGTSPDAGAYEWAGSANPGWLFAEDFKDVTPGVAVGPNFQRGCCNNDDGSQAWMVAPLFLLALLRRRRAGSGSAEPPE